jgi:hypothetical protein
MMRNRPWLIFAVFYGWKIALFLVTSQPIPGSDAYFYDGAVVNYLLHGGYFNPTVVASYPICGGQLFSANPPFYQTVLLGWMSVFGTSVASQMALHLFLLGLFTLLLFLILRRLQTPVWCMHLAGGFLFALTFHDRPDTVAQVLGMLATYAWLRSRRIFSPSAERVTPRQSRLWTWVMVSSVLLCLATSLQIGGTYFMLVLLGTAAAVCMGKERFPFAPMLVMVLVPPLLAWVVKTKFPLAWNGFQENVSQNTSFLTGLHWTTWPSMLKVLRTVPGVLLVAGLLLWTSMRRPRQMINALWTGPGMLLTLALLAAISVTALCQTMFQPELVYFVVCYLQPLVVGGYLAVAARTSPGSKSRNWQAAGFGLMILLGSVRAVGMSTWGLACSLDVSCSAANQRVREELQKQPLHSPVAVSAAFLYEAANATNVTAIHSDYVSRSMRLYNDTDALLYTKPTLVILTQFDYYRRYEPVIDHLQTNPHVRSLHVKNTARIRPPDSYRLWRQVVQHISWAPVIIDLSWQ